MATQQIVSSVVSLQKSAELAALLKERPQLITQDQLCHVLAMRQQIKAIEEKLEKAENLVRRALEAGGVIEHGAFKAFFVTTERRNVSWKNVATDLGDLAFGEGKGAEYVEDVLKSTAPTKTIRLEIQ